MRQIIELVAIGRRADRLATRGEESAPTEIAEIELKAKLCGELRALIQKAKGNCQLRRSRSHFILLCRISLLFAILLARR